MELFLQHLPIWPLIIPLLASALLMMPRIHIVAWFIAGATAITVFVGVVLMLIKLQTDVAPITYNFGGFLPPYGIAYKVDLLSAWMLTLVNGVAVLVVGYSYTEIRVLLSQHKQGVFYALLLLCLAGLNGMLLTNDAFHLYVCLEIASLATYALIATGKDKRALIAAYEYLILGTIGATFYLIALGLLYICTGTLNMADLAQRLPPMLGNPAVEAALAFLTLGLLLKIAAFPMHMWLANAYATAPSSVTVFLAATATKVSVYVLLRLIMDVYGVTYVFQHTPLHHVLLVLGVLGIVVASLTATLSVSVRRALAFSSIAQIGYILLGIGLATQSGLTAALVHIPNHAMAKALLFMAVGAVVLRTGGATLVHFSGIAKHMPITMAAFVVGGLSLIGIPGTAGFISKWILIQALIEAHQWWWIAVVVLGSLLATVYIWKAIEAAYFMPRLALSNGGVQKQRIQEAPMIMLIPMVVLMLVNVAAGLDTRLTLGIADKIAKAIYAPAITSPVAPAKRGAR